MTHQASSTDRDHPDSAPQEVTRILHALGSGSSNGTDELIPLVYHELRRLANYRLAQERPGQTLQGTALVHEAYIRLVKTDSRSWRDRRHFFGAAAEAMRRILIENARKKASQKRGGAAERADIDIDQMPTHPPSKDLLDLNEALKELEKIDPNAAELVKLRYFAGLTMEQTAQILEISPRTGRNLWAFGKTWLYQRLNAE